MAGKKGMTMQGARVTSSTNTPRPILNPSLQEGALFAQVQQQQTQGMALGGGLLLEAVLGACDGLGERGLLLAQPPEQLGPLAEAAPPAKGLKDPQQLRSLVPGLLEHLPRPLELDAQVLLRRVTWGAWIHEGGRL